MGVDQSAEQQTNPLAFLSVLLEKNYNTDHEFWVNLMKKAADRNISVIPDSIFLYDMAKRFPLNFVNLVLASVHEVVSLQKSEQNDAAQLSSTELNELNLALQIFTTSMSVLVTYPNLSYLLEHLDSDTYSKYKEIVKSNKNSVAEEGQKEEEKDGAAEMKKEAKSKADSKKDNKAKDQKENAESGQKDVQKPSSTGEAEKVSPKQTASKTADENSKNSNSNNNNGNDTKLPFVKQAASKINAEIAASKSTALPKDPNAAQKVPQKAEAKAAADLVQQSTPKKQRTPKKDIQKVESKVEKKVDQKVESKVEKKVDQKVESKVEKKVEQKVESKVEKKVEQKVKPKPESKVEQNAKPKAEQKVEPKGEQKSEAKAAPKSNAQQIQKVDQNPIAEKKPQQGAKADPSSAQQQKPRTPQKPKIGQNPVSDKKVSQKGEQKPKVEQKVETKVEQKVETKVEQKADQQKEKTPRKPKNEQKTKEAAETKAAPHPAPKDEQKAEAKANTKATPQAQPKVESKAQPKVESKEQPKVESKAQPKVESKAQPKVDAKSELKAVSNAEPKTDVKSEIQPKAEASAEQHQPQSSPKTKAAPKSAKRAASPAPAVADKSNNNAVASKRAKSPQPQRTAKQPAQQQQQPSDNIFLEKHRAMRANDGHVVSAFTDAAITLLFKDGATLEPPSSDWVQGGGESMIRMNRTRSDLLRSLLVVSSLHIFAPVSSTNRQNKKGTDAATDITDVSASLDALPHKRLIDSICRVAFQYMNELPKRSNETTLLLSNALCLCIRLFTNASFRKAFASVKPSFLLRSMHIDGSDKLPLFNALDPLSKYSLSFLYMSALFQPKFVSALTKKGLSNKFLYHLIWAAQLFFEQEGVNYIHSIILSTVLLVVADPIASSRLNDPFDEPLPMCKFQPDNQNQQKQHQNQQNTQNQPQNQQLNNENFMSYGDLILEVLLNFCQRDSFLPSLICVFHMIAPHVHTFSFSTASKMIALFERVYEKQKGYLPLFLEVFATIVQQRDNKKNGFCPVIFSRSALFRRIKAESQSSQRTLPIILRYIKKARILIKKENKQKIDIYEVSTILARINTEKLFPTPQMFVKHPHIFGGEIEKTWDQWADLVFQKTCEGEVKNIRKLRLHLANIYNQKH